MASLALVLLPGLDGTGVLFEPLVKRLPPEWRPIVVGYPGDQVLGYDELLPRVREALPAGERFVLLGESFSGPLAIRIAAERPAGLCGLVLVGSFATSPAPWMPRALHWTIQPLPTWLLRTSGHMFARTMGLFTPELKPLFRHSLEHVRPNVLAARVRATLTVDVSREFAEIAVPMLYLAARRDIVVPAGSWQRLQQARPDLEVQTMQATHLMLQTRPEESIAALRDFVKRCETTEPGRVGPVCSAS